MRKGWINYREFKVIMKTTSSELAMGPSSRRRPSPRGPLFLVVLLLSVYSPHVSAEPLAGRLTRGSPFWRHGHVQPTGLFCDFEGGLRAEGVKGEERGAESDDAGCAWKWSGGFRVVSGRLVNETLHSRKGAHENLSGPIEDAQRSPDGHFLLLQMSQTSPLRSVGLSRTHMRDFPRVWSPQFEMTGEHCKLEMMINMDNMADGSYKVVIEALNTSWIVTDKPGNDRASWERHNCTLGRINQEFHVMLEVISGGRGPAHFAIDNIRLNRCFPEIPVDNGCTSVTQYRCSDGLCLDRSRVCDIVADCRYAEDETISDCAKMPPYSRCTFEDGWCGWSNVEDKKLKWTIQSGPTPKDHTQPTGPTADHTYGNATGCYAFVSMSSAAPLSSEATLESVTFYSPPPYVRNASSPYHKSCQIRFYYHQFGPHSGSLGLFLVELNPPHGEKKTTQLWWSFGDQGDSWHRGTVPLVNVSSRYYLQFEARKGLSVLGDVGLDDISISPECFGIGVPQSEIKDWYPGQDVPKGTPVTPTPNPAFANATLLEIGTCGVKGREGPRPEDCTAETIGTAPVVVLTEPSFLAGVQKWVVPEAGVYTIVARGASGGKGSDGVGTSLGSTVRGVLELRAGEPLYFLVGQEGVNACTKNFAGGLSYRRDPLSMGVACNAAIKTSFSTRPKNPINDIKQMTFVGGGGGGGGGTFVFKWAKKKRVPLIVAGGGGGLAHGFISPPGTTATLAQRHGQGFNKSIAPVTGRSFGKHPAGAGGGWTDAVGWNLTWTEFKGSSLLRGGLGGKACVVSSNGYFGFGGFGGGGGGCESGGGGGGYQGGDAFSDKGASGSGGWSYVGEGVRMKKAWPGGQGEPWERQGPGRVFIIPALSRGACGCDYLCVALDEYRSKTQCICPSGWTLGNDSTSCVLPSTSPMLPYPYSISIGVAGCLLAFILASFCMFMYNRYQKKKNHSLRRKMLSGADLQLNRLRASSGGMMTEYNPNYEFGGGTYTIQDLKDIPRDNLRLVKALGQGAFGEVYQGLFRNRAGDAVEMPVAVKTLPERSSGQAEMDFLMEALIMSKFNHHNIVHFIGVCFDKHPRFIVLELLAGGDLKTFLRESRPKPDRPSPLTMKDLLNCSLDVAKGCKYMEENHFIHRDIAARNCLLTTKGPGRVVKIADFGMARDIYRADYYRKGGKAMLPVKWMPPEAFLDGIFTSKTDVWSFGVLLWEVMSLGYMPYTGRSNQEVMQLVTSGGRLEPPAHCPSPVYGIMTQCWHPRPDHRPSFSTLLERLGYCMQDPDVMSAPLPVFTRPPSAERDATIMRPSALDASTLLRVHRPENPPHPPTATSEDDLLPPPPTPPPPLNDDYLVPSPRPTTPSSSWGETSFVDPALVPPPPEPIATSSSRHHNSNNRHHSKHHHNNGRHHQHHNHHKHDASSSPSLPESRSTQPLLDDNSPGESPRRLPRELTNSVNSVSHKCGIAPSPASETPTRTSDISCSGGEGGADSRSSSQCDPRQAVGSLISLEEGEEAIGVPPPPGASLPPPVKISPALRHKNALRATLSLDPSALDRHGSIMDSVENVIKPPAQYANVTPTRTPATKREKVVPGVAAEVNQSSRNGSPSRASPAFTVQTTASTRHLLSDTEISC
ncbi:ALK tyrosine kinase receptor-like isoform X2 [Ischnura elegans]|uniref:ALK tyrosine kinase receptor-like isoform X2 n=1 Tax=Ischnura elegans TaxID=197161 RepID=UPI001ED88FC9|nr:ALK tyrosine kinase receptor-like isoform X2 [Ischnura elegans]